jgi:hypothetical protein
MGSRAGPVRSGRFQEDKNLAPAGIRTPDRPVSSLVAIPAALTRLLLNTYRRIHIKIQEENKSFCIFRLKNLTYLSKSET